MIPWLVGSIALSGGRYDLSERLPYRGTPQASGGYFYCATGSLVRVISAVILKGRLASSRGQFITFPLSGRRQCPKRAIRSTSQQSYRASSESWFGQKVLKHFADSESSKPKRPPLDRTIRRYRESGGLPVGTPSVRRHFRIRSLSLFTEMRERCRGLRRTNTAIIRLRSVASEGLL